MLQHSSLAIKFEVQRFMDSIISSQHHFIKLTLCFLIALSSCNTLPDSETKFFEIPDDHYNLLTDYAKSKISTMPSDNGEVKLMTSTIFSDSSMLPMSKITFEDGLGMTIQEFRKNKFTFDSISLCRQYSKRTIHISYTDLESFNDNRILGLQSGNFIDHLTIKSIPQSVVIKGESYLTVPLNDMKSFSYELNHSGINSFVINRDYEEGIFMMVLLERGNKVYLITFSNPKAKDFNFLEYLKIKEYK
jgi:hypothetical protein